MNSIFYRVKRQAASAKSISHGVFLNFVFFFIADVAKRASSAVFYITSRLNTQGGRSCNLNSLGSEVVLLSCEDADIGGVTCHKSRNEHNSAVNSCNANASFVHIIYIYCYYFRNVRGKFQLDTLGLYGDHHFQRALA